MFYGASEVTAIEVGGNGPFCATGHYPILVGYDESGRALYLAHTASDSSSRATCVLDGSSNAIFTDETGKTQPVSKYMVAVLRYDPSDWKAHYASTVGGTVDPTGPLHWRKLWPVEDPALRRLAEPKLFYSLQRRTFVFFTKCAQNATPS